MASTHTARVHADTLDGVMLRRGRVVVRVPGCKCEFSVEPGRVTFHDGEGMNYVMRYQRRIEYDDVLCEVGTPRYHATVTRVGHCGEAEFTVIDLATGLAHDDFLEPCRMGAELMSMTLSRRKQVLLLC